MLHTEFIKTVYITHKVVKNIVRYIHDQMTDTIVNIYIVSMCKRFFFFNFKSDNL